MSADGDRHLHAELMDDARLEEEERRAIEHEARAEDMAPERERRLTDLAFLIHVLARSPMWRKIAFALLRAGADLHELASAFREELDVDAADQRQ